MLALQSTLSERKSIYASVSSKANKQVKFEIQSLSFELKIIAFVMRSIIPLLLVSPFYFDFLFCGPSGYSSDTALPADRIKRCSIKPATPVNQLNRSKVLAFASDV